jgi:hypothetical protein
MSAWTNEMRRALEQAGDVPARVEVDGSVHVLLPQGDYAHVREGVPGLPELGAVADPASRQLYVLVPVAVYERIQPLFEEVPLSAEERQAALRFAGLRAGWNDPIWDDLDTPPTQP